MMMIGGFMSRGLTLLFGYAYPAYECFKAVEKNKVEIQELRFWCQYWIIVALLTVLERISDTFLSWFPMYGEMKLVLIIYLWYPKTKGTGYVYQALLQPYLSKHERDIDRSLLELRERAWNFVIFYCQNCTQLGSAKIVQLIQLVATKSAGVNLGSERAETQHSNGSAPPPPPTPPTTPSKLAKNTNSPRRSFTPRASSFPNDDTDSPRKPTTPLRSTSFQRGQVTQSGSFQNQANNAEDIVIIPDKTTDESGVDHHLHTARLKLRRFKTSDD